MCRAGHLQDRPLTGGYGYSCLGYGPEDPVGLVESC
ncbi:MAG: hypothetical protein RLZZ54_185 [Cyanobacteriota bacterium]|jgi:hypothetical protein